MAAGDELTLVVDIGKSHAKLLMLDGAGEVVERHTHANRSVASPLGYPALNIAGLTAWVSDTLISSTATQRCTHAIASTHGAAIVAVGEDGLAWDPLDYEYDGLTELHESYQRERDAFDATFAPDLPAGLNAARQLHWMQQAHPEAWARTRCLLPYPQYWAWWLSGVASCEVSSLGCHTQLWRPRDRRFSNLAVRHGWAGLFAPMQPAWAALGGVRADVARATGLSEACVVHVGVHDSNACLARYLHDDRPTTLVSTGTWVIAMASGISVAQLDPSRDMLANVSVHGEMVPTARFMGGRELERLCAGASPAQASVEALDELMRRDVQALPQFADQGGPFSGRIGKVLERGQPIDPAVTLSAPLRASLASLYCAQVTAHILQGLGANAPPIVEGPFADNPVYLSVLAELMAPASVMVSGDALEGTARGAWLLAHWNDLHAARAPVAHSALAVPGLRAHQQRWRELLT